MKITIRRKALRDELRADDLAIFEDEAAGRLARSRSWIIRPRFRTAEVCRAGSADQCGEACARPGVYLHLIKWPFASRQRAALGATFAHLTNLPWLSRQCVAAVTGEASNDKADRAKITRIASLPSVRGSRTMCRRLTSRKLKNLKLDRTRAHVVF